MNKDTRFARNIFSFRIKICAVVTVSLVFLLSACQTRDILLFSNHSTKINRAGQRDISAALGATQHSRLLETYGREYHDAKLERMLEKITNRLTAASQNPDLVYNVIILDSAHINAFSLPNGSIYVTSGMLELANDSSEVAAVLAHEMAHIMANHGLLRLQKEAELRQLDHVPVNILSRSRNSLQSAFKGKRQLAQFSRNQELQADSIGIEMLNRAGYDPFAAPRFLQSMEAYSAFRNTSGTTNTSLDFLATHPTTPKRILLAIKKASSMNAPHTENTDHDNFLKNIDGMIFGGNLREGYVRGNQFIHPQLRITFSVPNNFVIDNSAHTVLASGPNKIAVRFDTVPRPAEISASNYLKSGWIAGLDESSVQPITITQGLPAAHAYATNEHWQFDIVVILGKNNIFRFLTAAPRHSPNFSAVAKSTTQSFHLLSSSQLSELKPFKIRILRVKQGDSIASLSSEMRGTIYKEKLFRIINGLSPTQTLRTGTHVKIITE
ncbi:peptidase, M48 family [Bartonella australis AUST/NH1]|uniref:Peptidase, M48 family n=1 Tax=Bartonella australis (strain Aust/NH1) TaxID=1094489 RepID=M1NUU6_BARAA|nr:peptidase, M48 family [Bartonella australis AUST/NH1]